MVTEPDLASLECHVLAGAYAGDLREDILNREVMKVGGAGGCHVLDEDDVIGQFPCAPRGGLDAVVGRDAAQHDRVDPSPAELEVEVGAGEGAPVAFEDDDVALLAQAGHQGAPAFGHRAHAGPQRVVDPLAGKIRAVRAPADMDEEDGRARLAKAGGEVLGCLHDLRASAGG